MQLLDVHFPTTDGRDWSSLATHSPSRINNSYSPNSDGACRAGPTSHQRKIRGPRCRQTFSIRPLNLLGFYLPTRPSSERPASEAQPSEAQPGEAWLKRTGLLRQHAR